MCLDEALLQGIGAARQLAEAEFPVDTPPKGFLTFLKTGLGAHLKAHGYKYRQMLDREIAKIKVRLQHSRQQTGSDAHVRLMLRFLTLCFGVVFENGSG